MRKLRTKHTVTLALGLASMLGGLAIAQQVIPGQRERDDRAAQPQPDERQPGGQFQPGAQTIRPGDQQRNAGNATQDVQRYLATCWLGKNQAEVEISEFAEQKAENPKVKEFARMLVEDHSKLIPKLEPLAAQAGEAGRQPGGLGARAIDIQPPGTPGAVGQPGAQGGFGNPAFAQLIAIEKKIGERCKENLREELEQKSGAEFDMCYVGSQIGSHMQASAALEVISQQGGELGQLASQAKQTVDHHLQEAKRLAQQLEGQDSGSRQQTGAIRDRNIRPTGGER